MNNMRSQLICTTRKETAVLFHHIFRLLTELKMPGQLPKSWSGCQLGLPDFGSFFFKFYAQKDNEA
jgi:hypothetical protein